MKKISFLKQEIILFISLSIILGVATYFSMGEAYEDVEFPMGATVIEDYQENTSFYLKEDGYVMDNWESSKLGFKNYQGECVIESKYSDLKDFKKGCCIGVIKDESYYLSTVNGGEITKEAYEGAEPLDEPAPATTKVTADYENNRKTTEFSEGKAFIFTENKITCISENKSTLFEINTLNGNYENIQSTVEGFRFIDGKCMVSKNGYDMGLINKFGKWIFKPNYSNFQIKGDYIKIRNDSKEAVVCLNK